MQRFPDGVDKQGFYSKDAPGHFPDWIERTSVKKKGGTVNHVVCNNAATLVYLANQGCVTLHQWPSRKDRIRNPDLMIFDLDPPGDDFGLVKDVARELRELVTRLGLAPYLKTTGGKGLHVAVPLDRRADFEEVRAFARDVAIVLAAGDPRNLTTEVRKEKRRGRLFLDTGRNAYGQHAVAPYSLRPRPGAPVATPLDWDELGGGVRPTTFTMKKVLGRVSEGLDPWIGMRRRAKSLAQPRRRLDRLLAEAS
jgi:bifunctional non-homologous end joining protein LigD